MRYLARGPIFEAEALQKDPWTGIPLPLPWPLFLLSALHGHLRGRHDTCFYAFFQAAESQRLAKRCDLAA